jgi:PhnB protein
MPIKASKAIPEGMSTVTVNLWFNGNCNEAIKFYQKAFGAELMGPIAYNKDGETVCHAMIRIGNSPMMMADAWSEGPESGPDGSASAGLWLYVEDCDALFDRAEKAGCEVLMPMWDGFWGDRMGKLIDPFGHCWAIASRKWIMSEEEVAKGQAEWQKSMEEYDGHCGEDHCC